MNDYQQDTDIIAVAAQQLPSVFLHSLIKALQEEVKSREGITDNGHEKPLTEAKKAPIMRLVKTSLVKTNFVENDLEGV